MPSRTLALIAAVVGIIVAVLVGGYFVMNKKSSETSPTTGTTSTSQDSQDSGSTKGSLKSLLGSNKNQTCSISYPDGSGEGTVYVSGNKMRGDFTMTAEGKSYDGHMISDGDYFYSWSSQMPQGMKMKMDDVPDSSDQSSQGSVDLDSQVDLNCSSWRVDNSKFEVPSDVTFTEFNLPAATAAPTTGAGTGQTSICDSITDPTAKVACQQAGY
ncbi:MAG TPA: hypothetical protein VIK81_01670 [Patescibacteria group bacterium]